jgi:predicted O-methyltransferase YrrM
MFDRDQNFLDNARKYVGGRFTFSLMDVSVDGDVSRSLGEDKYDVIIDDSSHDFYHQIRIIKEAWPRLKSGGILVIEDIFRNEDFRLLHPILIISPLEKLRTMHAMNMYSFIIDSFY